MSYFLDIVKKLEYKNNEARKNTIIQHLKDNKIKYKLEKLSFLKHLKNDNPYGVRNQQLVDVNSKVMQAVEDKKIKSMNDLSNFLKTLESNYNN